MRGESLLPPFMLLAAPAGTALFADRLGVGVAEVEEAPRKTSPVLED